MEFLKNNKGTIATLLGLTIAIPVNIYLMVVLFGLDIKDIPDDLKQVEKYFTYLKLVGIFIGSINLIAIVWYILPSKIEIDGKFIKIKMED